MVTVNSIFQKISKTAAGLDILINADGEATVRLVILSKEKKSFKILTAAAYGNIHEAVKQMPAGSPLVVSVDGYGIIHKTIDKKDMDEGIAGILPNAKISDLYIQKIHQEGTEKVIFSVARKEKIDEITATLNDSGFYPCSIILGPFGITALLPLIPPNEKIETPEYNIEVRDGVIFSFGKREDCYSPKEIDFGNQFILPDYLAAFSGCIGFFAPTGLITNNISAIEAQQKEYLSKKLIYLSGTGITAAIFLALIINMLLFSKYSSENRLLNQRIQYGQKLMIETDSLKKILTVREAFIEKSSDNTLAKMAYFSDRLASVIPPSITLERLNVYPPETAANNRNMPVFNKNAIIVTGYLNSPGALERVIKELSGFEWIKTADLINYTDNGSDPAYFTVEIKTE